MASSFNPEPAYKHDESDVILMPVAAGQTFLVGAFVVAAFGTTGQISECGANPAAITGIALASAAQGLAVNNPYKGTNIPVLILQPDTILKMSSVTTPVFGTHMGVSYGITKTGNVWQLDISKTGGTSRFVVVNIAPSPSADILTPEFFMVKLLPSFNALTAILS